MGPSEDQHGSVRLNAPHRPHKLGELRLCCCCSGVFTSEHNSDQSTAPCCNPCPGDDCFAASCSSNLHVRELVYVVFLSRPVFDLLKSLWFKILYGFVDQLWIVFDHFCLYCYYWLLSWFFWQLWLNRKTNVSLLSTDVFNLFTIHLIKVGNACMALLNCLIYTNYLSKQRKTCRWTQLKFYWTLVKIINKWIHCHHVRNQWTKTMHYYVCFNGISICFVSSTFISAFTTTEIRSTFAICGSNFGWHP